MARHDITLTVNGKEQSLTVDSETLLVHALREELDYTGPKVGCQSTMCGACTVQLDGDPVKSCTLFAVQADGREVTTVEGLGDQDNLHPLQESFRAEHGLQCGYCTPGMLMTADGLLEENPDPDREEIREALEGNICRCTGYENIVNAVESAAAKGEGGSDD
ncbi:(2Fe-2S)-binding protein [Halobacterium wangiae]|uniref:(2Fe-2S)-binding protein n=1 Tax=Halobacterium wangiae TaxID=2902623 RepID=UPI001E337C1D|nr:(2Fe-2S)-binding protein [Halobacterium wangiae]